jgi:hypothetical protein
MLKTVCANSENTVSNSVFILGGYPSKENNVFSIDFYE